MGEDSDNGKYTVELDKSVPKIDSSRIESRCTDNMVAEIVDVRLSERTKRKIDANGQCSLKPTVDVYFEVDETSEFLSSFYLDPFVTEDTKPQEMFGTVVSEALVSWKDLADIIGNEVVLYGEVGRTDVTVGTSSRPHDYRPVSEVEKSEFCDGALDSQLCSILYNQIKNLTVGYATLDNLDIRDNMINIYFKLPTGHIFSNVFGIRRHKTRWGKSKSRYDFWDFSKDLLGYVPSKSEYKDLLSKRVQIEYLNGKWYPKSRLS